ncbi:hypothetical protein ACHAAC_00855 [Aeromicrobium sp. CF4.19]|uniref:hypothetical protein n=1 Tax=Aeromicrobium sp. CF4.19 TaxID=3373082 RepID=UPI003EE5996C
MATKVKDDKRPAGPDAGSATSAGKGSKKDQLKAAEKALTKDVRRLRATIDALEAKLDKQRRKTAKWKSEAKAERTRAAKLDAALRRATAERPLEHGGDVPVPPPGGSSGGPSGSWTVVRLRAAAQERGVAGASRMTKAQLVAALEG